MSRTVKIIIAVAVVLVLAGAGAFFFAKSSGSGPTIKTATVADTTLGVTVSASGKVTAGQRTDIYPPTVGTLAKVYVKDGQAVEAGDEVAVVEAMKMRNVLRAPAGGVISEVLVAPGDTVAADQALVRLA